MVGLVGVEEGGGGDDLPGDGGSHGLAEGEGGGEAGAAPVLPGEGFGVVDVGDAGEAVDEEGFSVVLVVEGGADFAGGLVAGAVGEGDGGGEVEDLWVAGGFFEEDGGGSFGGDDARVVEVEAFGAEPVGFFGGDDDAGIDVVAGDPFCGEVDAGDEAGGVADECVVWGGGAEEGGEVAGGGVEDGFGEEDGAG